MAAVLRMCRVELVNPVLRSNCFSATRSMAVMKPMTPEEHTISKTEFWSKNKQLGRPISPHLTIYKFQLTSMLSITHRATGLIQSGILSGFAIAAMSLPGTFPMWLDYLNSFHFGAPLIFTAKFALAWPVTYHLFNGVRHLAWDMGLGFKIPDLYKSGYFVVALSVLFALGIAAM
eukprot:TRINITY_DN14283_c0_g1_i1.p1 TRINITY_DN14283_c0_g1~~TRINITY_DN14283_c0_g1_i1.p1  ORF type:complete len:185 (+),score=39.81 TRINITY_DN14283_c0_g1_i1:33-557(+)